MIPNNIRYFRGASDVHVRLILDKAFSIFGGVEETPLGGARDYLGQMTLREAIENQFPHLLVWMQVIDFRFGKPYFVAEYKDSTWIFYPHGERAEDIEYFDS